MHLEVFAPPWGYLARMGFSLKTKAIQNKIYREIMQVKLQFRAQGLLQSNLRLRLQLRTKKKSSAPFI